MNNLDDLEDYTKQTEDVELGLLAEIVKKYGNKVPAILKEIKNKHIKSDNKEEAEVIFSTVHKSKGMEYDAVKLAHDFIDKEKIQFLQDEFEGNSKNTIIEEINLLYVAITRTKFMIQIPENYLPPKFKAAKCIIPMTVINQEQEQIHPESELARQIKKKYPNSFEPWTTDQDEFIKKSLSEGISIKQISIEIKRSTTAVRKRMNVLNINSN